MLNDLLNPIPPNARPMNSLSTRLAAALARPWQTEYAAPTLRTIDALAYALRGYDVYWTSVAFDEERPSRVPASVNYRIFKTTPTTQGDRVTSHGVGLSSLFPGWAHLAESNARDRLARLRYKLRWN